MGYLHTIPAIFLLSLWSTVSIVNGNEIDVNTKECALPCENGGECRVGPAIASELADLPFTDKYTAPDDMHCHCPRGYIGTLCEVQLEICTAQDEICLDGSKCKLGWDADGKVFYYCGCSAAGADGSQSIAGRMCQHASTTFCKEGLAQSFCANGGNCTKISSDRGAAAAADDEESTGCICPADYGGQHCEIDLNNPSNMSKTTSSSNPNPNAVLAVIIIFMVCLALIFTFLTVTGKVSPFSLPASWYSSVSESEGGADDFEMTSRRTSLTSLGEGDVI